MIIKMFQILLNYTAEYCISMMGSKFYIEIYREMFKNLLKNYNVTICEIITQAASDSLDFTYCKTITTNQVLGLKRVTA